MSGVYKKFLEKKYQNNSHTSPQESFVSADSSSINVELFHHSQKGAKLDGGRTPDIVDNNPLKIETQPK